MSEKLCLQWNDFKDNVILSFGSLREDKDFADVTLVSEDGKQMEVHKGVLACSSQVFKNILKTNMTTNCVAKSITFPKNLNKKIVSAPPSF